MNEFKLIVAGGRNFNHPALLHREIVALTTGALQGRSISIASGMARGADHLGYLFAKQNKAKCFTFPAKWELHGKKAGFIRNTEMAEFADGVIAFWDGESRGTKHMIDTMEKMGKQTFIVRYAK